MGRLLLFCVAMQLSLSTCQLIIPKNYSKNFRPTNANGEPLDVLISMKINGIQEIDPNTMTIRLHIYLRVVWKDDRLKFPTEYLKGNSTDEFISMSWEMLDQLWTPDHFFRNTRDVKKFKLLQEAGGIKLNSQHQLYTSSMYDIQFGCPMSFRNFPFDTQYCIIRMGSYIHSRHEVKFGWHSMGLSVDEDVSKQLEGYDFKIEPSNDTLCECLNCFPDKTPCITVLVILNRRYVIYLMSYFIPSFLFVIVSWTSFFWPAEVIPGRTVLVITSLLTVSSLFASARYDTPVTSYVKAIDAWMFFTMVVAVLSLFEYAVVLQWIRMKEYTDWPVRPVSQVSKPQVKKISAREKYQMYQDRTEAFAKIGMPILIVGFNLIYWPVYVSYKWS